MAQTTEGAIKQTAARWGITVEEYHARIVAGEQRCTKCKTWKPLASFDIDRSRLRGRAMTCKECKNPRTRPGPSIPERRAQRALGLKWCSGCEAWLAAEQVHNGVCRFHANEADRRRYATDARIRADRRQRVHARKRKVDPISPHGQEARLELFDGRCAYCPAQATTWDHIVPVSMGGQSTPGNIVPCCVSCNSRKRTKDLSEWLDEGWQQPHEALVEVLSLAQMPTARTF